MPTVHLPRNCTLNALSQEIGAAGALGSDWEALVVHFDTGCFIHCSAMAFLCIWGHQQVLAGRRMLLRGGEDALRYLARIDLHEHLGVEYDARLEWAVNEIIDNILIHAESPVPGAICARYFPHEHRLDVSICGGGRGIKAPKGTPPATIIALDRSAVL